MNSPDMDINIEITKKFENLALSQRLGGSEEPTGETSKSKPEREPLDQETFFSRLQTWSEAAEKRNRGAVAINFEAVSDLGCVADTTYWGLTPDEYRSGVHKITVSPKPDEPALRKASRIRSVEDVVSGGLIIAKAICLPEEAWVMIPWTVS